MNHNRLATNEQLVYAAAATSQYVAGSMPVTELSQLPLQPRAYSSSSRPPRGNSNRVSGGVYSYPPPVLTTAAATHSMYQSYPQQLQQLPSSSLEYVQAGQQIQQSYPYAGRPYNQQPQSTYQSSGRGGGGGHPRRGGSSSSSVQNGREQYDEQSTQPAHWRASRPRTNFDSEGQHLPYQQGYQSNASRGGYPSQGRRNFQEERQPYSDSGDRRQPHNDRSRDRDYNQSNPRYSDSRREFGAGGGSTAATERRGGYRGGVGTTSFTSPSSSQHLGHGSQAVQGFYNGKRDIKANERRTLETIHIRVFHNWVKSVLIQKYGEITREIVRQEALSFQGPLPDNFLYVFDAACGKGGDHKKWMMHSSTAFYVGVDIAFESLNEAHKRAVKTLDEIKMNSRYHSNIKFGFFEKDLTLPPEEFWKHILTDGLINSEDQDSAGRRRRQDGSETFLRQHSEYMFDMISCQMAMHYMLSTETSARNFLLNCTRKLNDYGFMLVTFTDAERILNIIKTKGKAVVEEEETTDGSGPAAAKRVEYKNKHFALQFKTDIDKIDLSDPQQTYGQKYGFYLQEAVGQESNGMTTFVPEFMIDANRFALLASEYELVVRENANFVDFYNANKTEYHDLLIQMKVPYSNEEDKKDPEAWEISHCYRVLVLQKITKTPSRLIFDRTTRDKFLYKYPVPANFQPKTGK